MLIGIFLVDWKLSALLWTAPELLRAERPPPNGTQPGDIYSFAIVLQEIVYRCPPYQTTEEQSSIVIKGGLSSESWSVLEAGTCSLSQCEGLRYV